MDELAERAATNYSVPVEKLLRLTIDRCKTFSVLSRPQLVDLEEICEGGVQETELDYATKGSPMAFTESDAVLKLFVKEYIFDAETGLSKAQSSI